MAAPTVTQLLSPRFVAPRSDVRTREPVLRIHGSLHGALEVLS